jgi:hypothetical protein
MHFISPTSENKLLVLVKLPRIGKKKPSLSHLCDNESQDNPRANVEVSEQIEKEKKKDGRNVHLLGAEPSNDSPHILSPLGDVRVVPVQIRGER